VVATNTDAGTGADTGPPAGLQLPLGLPESKFERPAPRPGITPRLRVLGAIEAAGPVPVVAVVAPAGYGKSTLLAQWAATKDPDSAWVSCDEGDNDPAVLMTCLAAALARLGTIEPRLVEPPGLNAGITAVPALMDAIRPDARPAVVVLDHVEAITNRECHYILAEVALRLPPGWQLAMASRHALPLPLPRLRLQGGVLELGARDLAMSADEARRLLDGTGGAPDDAALTELLDSTEGWPIGLYLAGLTIKAGIPWRGASRTGTDGDDVGTYLRAEILEQMSDAELTFLTRSSVLARLCGPLCDATVGSTGSARLLEQLERRNLLVVSLDRRREWYRYHHLLREILTEELRRREPDLVPQLHARAAAWLETHGLADEAIDHAQQAGDTDLAARLVLDRMQPVWASGRIDTVLRWMTWFDREGGLHRYPGLAIHGALVFALLGRVGEAEAWAQIARAAPADVLLPDGNTTGSLLAYLRTILAQDGIETMRADARAGFAELAPSSPYRATMLFAEGMSYLLEGDLDRADPVLALAREDAERVGALPLAAMVLAERCFVAEERNDAARVEALAAQALAIVEAGGFEQYWTSALVYAWAARAALGRGDVRAARVHAANCTRLRPLLGYSIPVAPVQALLELSRVYLGLGDAGGAEAALRQAEEILAERPRLGVLGDQAHQLRATLERVAEDPVGASALTAAELRLLPLLATHLSLGQIGERLHVGRATVKAQTTSIYRKLRVSSRGDAVSRSRELGLDVH
jgi:LuxR family transcriptional regulator, maltose regulon positive regulatory protein